MSLAVRRSASFSSRASAVTRMAVPSSNKGRARERTSEKSVTSYVPAESESVTQAMRLPVRVLRSLEATTVPASLRRVPPARAREAISAEGTTPRRFSTAA